MEEKIEVEEEELIRRKGITRRKGESLLQLNKK